MADNIHLVRTVQTEISESVLEVVDAIMADAKAGKIAAIAVAVIRPDDCMNCTYSQTDKAAYLLGAVHLLSSRLLASIDS